jgi:hypothetical protein
MTPTVVAADRGSVRRRDYYAQSPDGRVWYFGEHVDDIKGDAPLDDVSEFKSYCPGVGLVREEPPAAGWTWSGIRTARIRGRRPPVRGIRPDGSRQPGR